MRKTVARVTRPTPANTPIPHKLLAPGYHVAPFLNSSGAIAIIAIADDGRLGGVLQIEAGSCEYSVGLVNPRMKISPEIVFNDMALFRTHSAMDRNAWDRLSPGVHAAPWKPRQFEADAVALLVIAPNGTLWGMIEAAAEHRQSAVEEAFEQFGISREDGNFLAEHDLADHEAIDISGLKSLRFDAARLAEDRHEFGRFLELRTAGAVEQ